MSVYIHLNRGTFDGNMVGLVGGGVWIKNLYGQGGVGCLFDMGITLFYLMNEVVAIA